MTSACLESFPVIEYRIRDYVQIISKQRNAYYVGYIPIFEKCTRPFKPSKFLYRRIFSCSGFSNGLLSHCTLYLIGFPMIFGTSHCIAPSNTHMNQSIHSRQYSRRRHRIIVFELLEYQASKSNLMNFIGVTRLAHIRVVLNIFRLMVCVL